MSLDNSMVSVIIPNYNGLELLKSNIPSIISAMKEKVNRIKEIIIVDDDSNDGSILFIREKYPFIRIIKHKVNRGFATSVNTGVRSAKSEFICLLNSDVFVSSKFLSNVFKHFQDRKVFGISLHEKGYGPALGKFEEGFITHAGQKEATTAKDTFWISGGSGIFRRESWISLGGFDDRIFKFYWEDIDLSYRALKRGYRLLWEPMSLVEHKHESTTSRVFSQKKLLRMQEISQLAFIWKNLTSSNLFRKHMVGLSSRILRHPGYLRIFLGVSFKLKIVRRARKKEKKETVISDEAIFASFSGK